MTDVSTKDTRKTSPALKRAMIIAGTAAGICLLALAAILITLNSKYSYIKTEDGERIRINRADNAVYLSGTHMRSIAPLCGIENLYLLDLSGATADLSSLGKLTSLIELDISDTGFNDISALSMLTELKTLNATGNGLSTDDFDLLQEALPDCTITWDVPFMGTLLSSSTTSLTLDDTAQEADFANLKYFSCCTSINAEDCTNYDALLELWYSMPECEIVWNYDLFGHELNSLSTEVDLRGTMFDSPDELLEQLRYLPSLTYCDMCGCGLTNAEMDILREAYPDIKFVWYIQFAHWTVRTDITCFSALNGYDGRMGNDIFEPLFTYCTDLVALDIGHHGLTDLEPLRNLTKLKYLILADNLFTDISPLADLKELVYLELFLNRRVKDLSPLAELTNMVDLNLCHIYVGENYDFLYSMPNLKLVYMNLCRVPRTDYDKIYADFPDARMVLTLEQYSSTVGGWRETERNRGLVYAFRDWENVRYFREWNDIEYWEDGETSGTRLYGRKGYGYYETATGRTYNYSDAANKYKFDEWYE